MGCLGTFLFVILILVFIVWLIPYAIEENQKEKARQAAMKEQKEREKAAAQREQESHDKSINDTYQSLRKAFNLTYNDMFNDYVCNHAWCVKKMAEACSSVASINETEERVHFTSELAEMQEMLTTAQAMNAALSAGTVKSTILLDVGTHYGQVDAQMVKLARRTSAAEIDAYNASVNDAMKKRQPGLIRGINRQQALINMWAVAFQKPFDVTRHNRTSQVYQKVLGGSDDEIIFVELCGQYQVGGEDSLRPRINAFFKNGAYCPDLGKLASVLMWIGAYDSEYTILQYMLSNNRQMTQQQQERLHMLANGTGASIVIHNVDSEGKFYFEADSVSWKEADLDTFFANLRFNNQTLTYALAIRDDTKTVNMGAGFRMPPLISVQQKLRAALGEEYGDCVTADVQICGAMNGKDVEDLNGILVKVSECPQLGLLVCPIGIGKNLNIKYYTLVLPTTSTVDTQNQQARALLKKTSPSAVMWEDGLKTTVTHALEKILSTTTSSSTNSNSGNDSPVF